MEKLNLQKLIELLEQTNAVSTVKEDLKTVYKLSKVKEILSEKRTGKQYLEFILEKSEVDFSEKASKQELVDEILKIFEDDQLENDLESKVIINNIKIEAPKKEEEFDEDIEVISIQQEEVASSKYNFYEASIILQDCILAETKIQCNELNLFRDMPISKQDKFCVRVREEINLEFVAVLKESEIIAVGYLIESEEKDQYYINFDEENIKFDEFEGNNSYQIYVVNKNEKIKYVNKCTIKLKDAEFTENTLCIDFGTSNTCAGSYGIKNKQENNIEIVTFTNKGNETELYPTVVCIEDCSDRDNIQYLFGYEALNEVQNSDYATQASVFFEIKRFMTTLDVIEEISDTKGNTAKISRGELVKAYILNTIKLAQNYFKIKFKKLHFSSPVKLKNTFYKGLSKILKDCNYEILSVNDSIDEGLAIVYNTVMSLVQKSYSQNKKYDDINIMILDCGGGTSDLASCEVKYVELEDTKKLVINSHFVNGNSNFGGNNITYKIFQLIKIKLVYPELKINELINHDENAILDKFDYVKNELENKENRLISMEEFEDIIYGDFNKKYKECEKIIPTIFKKSDSGEIMYEDEIICKKRNYYYLWQLAEKIKIKFYEENLVDFKFNDPVNTKLDFSTQDCKVYCYDENKDLELKSIPQISITIKDIQRLLCGDIYHLLNALLADDDFTVNSYTNYKLAGQSCKINLFMDLLKEFIPGRKLRTNSERTDVKIGDKNSSKKLKVDCIEGCIAYIRDREFGRIKPEIKLNPPKLIYYITNHEERKQIDKDNENEINLTNYPTDTIKAEYEVLNMSHISMRKILFDFTTDLENKPITIDELINDIDLYCYLNEDGLNDLRRKIESIVPLASVGSRETKTVFMVPAKEGYGVNIYYIEKTKNHKDEEYKLCKKIYENYEDEVTKTFFDGSR